MSEVDPVINIEDTDMTDGERNRKRGASAVADPKTPLNPPPHNGSGDLPLLLLAPEIPPSPSAKQEPKRNKPTSTGTEKGPARSLASSKQIDARLAGPQGGLAMRNESTMLELSRGWQTRDSS